VLKLGEILIEKGIASPQQIDMALKESKRTGEVLGKVLVKTNIISEKQLLEVLGEQLDLEFKPALTTADINKDAVKAVPARLIWHYKFMPLDLKERTLTIAVSDPLAVWVMEDLKLQLGFDVERILAPEKEILKSIRQYYGLGAETVEEILEEEKKKGGAEEEAVSVHSVEIEDLEKAAKDTSVIKLVNQMLSEAINQRATDIHIEPYRNDVKVRYRIDGILYNIQMPSEIKRLHQAIVSRIKILSNLNVVERRLPQDGRAIVKIQDKQVDLRISIIPSIYGENVVIRILPVNLMFNLSDLGLDEQEKNLIEQLIAKPHGIIFLTGPTGSGKTTTLYACLSRLNQEAVKIITIEDPVEYELDGITQIQVKPEIEFTFANALRSILRHDPDIMMVGEVRDFETAELSIRTSLTGHLIFSTLHTNYAASGATRLIDIGVEPYLISSSVIAFISQRLVRQICPKCKKEKKNNTLLPEHLSNEKVYYGEGCAECGNLGYIGRTAIYEILVIDDEIRKLIMNKASAGEVAKAAEKKGFKSLLESGVDKIKQGVTTPEEVIRVVGI
jgi:type II secretory ATPase GspE/PulE/Tfp pilus assembly ATPase PilB-like protein